MPLGRAPALKNGTIETGRTQPIAISGGRQNPDAMDGALRSDELSTLGNEIILTVENARKIVDAIM